MINNGKLLRLNKNDNVGVVLENIRENETVTFDGILLKAGENIDRGHKIAVKDMAEGEDIIKYGFPIGHAVKPILAGEYIHTHNIKTNLKGLLDYSYLPALKEKNTLPASKFMGYIRENKEVGIRNEIWIVNTVGCVNKTSEIIAKEANRRFAGKTDGIFAFAHPYGCSQLGDDHLATQKILAGMVKHPNAAGVLVIGLGCENNNITEFKKVLGDYSPDRVKFLVTQEVEDEIEEGLKLIGELVLYAGTFKRQVCSADKLTVGLKCGGSDAFSGITANPLVGEFSDLLIAQGGTSILTEVPEMFGAETILMNRCIDEEVFQKTVHLINDFKEYFMRYNQEIYENPSPGNKKGGISTLEEKSLGCTQKGGSGNVVDVLDYGERAAKPGLNLLKGPGNDIVAATALTAAGAHIILFTTGRGTPLGAPVPTIKISTNSELYRKKSSWIDYDAGSLLDGNNMEEVRSDFFNFVLKVASGEDRARNEENGYREIAIFKDGVTL
ncbi:MAG TPA: altronate dehydratase family protein [Clostridia bacterium]|nr:altronate dehydratase family protein [Clostridia bacterium]